MTSHNFYHDFSSLQTDYPSDRLSIDLKVPATEGASEWVMDCLDQQTMLDLQLSMAASYNDLPKLKEMLLMGASPIRTFKALDPTCLETAAALGRTEIVKALLPTAPWLELGIGTQAFKAALKHLRYAETTEKALELTECIRLLAPFYDAPLDGWQILPLEVTWGHKQGVELILELFSPPLAVMQKAHREAQQFGYHQLADRLKAAEEQLILDQITSSSHLSHPANVQDVNFMAHRIGCINFESSSHHHSVEQASSFWAHTSSRKTQAHPLNPLKLPEPNCHLCSGIETCQGSMSAEILIQDLQQERDSQTPTLTAPEGKVLEQKLSEQKLFLDRKGPLRL